MRNALLRALLFLSSLSASFAAAAQEQQAPGLANAKFEEGSAGAAPPGWFFASQSGGTVALDATAPHEGALSACIDATAATGSQRFANLMQSFDATPFRKQRVRYRAAVRTAELAAGGAAQLWCRVDRAKDKDGNPQFGGFDNMGDRPIRAAEWQTYDIVLDVADDAERIVLGMFVTGSGQAWLDDASFGAVDADVAKTETAAAAAAAARPARPIDPRVQQALAAADKAPQQSFWTPWLLLPALAIALFLVGVWPPRRAVDAGAPEAPEAPPPAGGLWRAFALRFAVAYWLLYCLPIPLLDVLRPIPGTGEVVGAINGWHRRIEAAMAAWTGRTLFGIDGDLVPPNGSGDTTQGYLTILNWFAIALALAAAWTALRRRRGPRELTVDLLRSYLRYVLALAMLGYGLDKLGIQHNQFPVVGAWRLDKTWADTSPMGLVWGFMGASRPYTMFAGGGEVLGALLLIWRRTAGLGALVTVGVMTNVMMLNFCYDVPVKIYSTHLLLMAVLILVADARRLLGVFLSARRAIEPPTELARRGPVSPWLRWPLKLAVLGCAFGVPLWHWGVETWHQLLAEPPAAAAPAADGAAKAPLLTSRGYRWINEVPFNR